MAKPVKIIPASRRRRKQRWKWPRRAGAGLVLLALGVLLMPQPVRQEVRLPQLPQWPQAAEEQLTGEQQQVAVYDHQSGQIMTLGLEDYLVGVVAAEMPASFELEALKAQAVAARTFACSRLWSEAAAADAPYRLTTDPATCQAWISDEEMQTRWGQQYAANREKIVQAVAQTQGEILTYQGKVIEPVYHASCGGGRTESARDVWGSDRPYLISVVCDHPSDKHTQLKTTLSLAEVDQKLGSDAAVVAAASSGQSSPLAIVASSASDRVLKMRVGSKQYSGSAVRQALGLESSLISFDQEGDEVTFTTNGYGHGVGMCQYGADYYAGQGWDYQAILKHYYTGVSLNRL